jgi:hypothetical protein
MLGPFSPQLENPPSQPNPQINAGSDEAYGKLSLSFEANQGQTDPQVKFLFRGAGSTLFLNPAEVVLTLENDERRMMNDELKDPDSSFRIHHSSFQTAVVRMKLADANPSPEVIGLDELPGKVNYFIGNDPEKWRSNIPTYAKVKYEDVYPGVDMIYYGNQRQLEYDFVVAPGADPSVIRLSFEGTDKMEVDGQGNLILHVAGGDVIQRAPKIYQDIGGVKQAVSGHYVVEAASNPQSAIHNPQSENPQSTIRNQWSGFTWPPTTPPSRSSLIRCWSTPPTSVAVGMTVSPSWPWTQPAMSTWPARPRRPTFQL